MTAIKRAFSVLNISVTAARRMKSFPVKSRARSSRALNIIIIITLSGLALSSCLKDLAIDYSIMDENIIDAPDNTLVSLKIKISGEITPDNCRELLNRLYNQYRYKKGLDFSKKQNGLFFYLYDSTETADDPEQWLGMLNWASPAAKPQITIKENLIPGIKKGITRKFGLSLKKRKEIFEAAVLASERATFEAQNKFPILTLDQSSRQDISYSQILSTDKANKQLKKQTEYIRLNAPKYLKETARKFNISDIILTEIIIEGYRDKWPLPVLEEDPRLPGD